MTSSSRRALWLATGAFVAVAAGTAGVASAAPAEDIRGAGSATAVEGRYIAVLNDTASASSATSLASQYDGTVGHTYDHALNGFSVAMDEGQARRLAADPSVEYVQAVQRVEVDEPAAVEEPANMGLDRIDQRDLPLDGEYAYPDSAGAGSTVYVISTGVRTTHEEFEDRARIGHDFVDDGEPSEDCHGNGTALAGVAAGKSYGVAKKASIVSVRVLDCGGSSTTETVVASVDWVAEDAAGKPAVASIGFSGPSDQALDQAIGSATAAGVTFAVPAGNSAANACEASPGSAPEALTVGGTETETDEASGIGNFGECLDMFAPATNITSASFEDDTSAIDFSGTTAAAAHVAGAAALYLGTDPDADAAKVTKQLIDNATPDVVTNPGAGSPNLLLYTGFMLP